MDRSVTAADRDFLLMLKAVTVNLYGLERSLEYFPQIILFLHLIRRNAYDDGHIISMEQAYLRMGDQPNLLSHFRRRN